MKPQIIDPTFLAVHPVTLKWWQQREQCRQCRHYIAPKDLMSCSLGGERCNLAPSVTMRKNERGYCIDARGTESECGHKAGGICGPGATLFEPKQVAA